MNSTRTSTRAAAKIANQNLETLLTPRKTQSRYFKTTTGSDRETTPTEQEMAKTPKKAGKDVELIKEIEKDTPNKAKKDEKRSIIKLDKETPKSSRKGGKNLTKETDEIENDAEFIAKKPA